MLLLSFNQDLSLRLKEGIITSTWYYYATIAFNLLIQNLYTRISNHFFHDKPIETKKWIDTD